MEGHLRIGTYFPPGSGTGHGAAVGQARRYCATPESLHALMHLGLGVGVGLGLRSWFRLGLGLGFGLGLGLGVGFGLALRSG